MWIDDGKIFLHSKSSYEEEFLLQKDNLGILKCSHTEIPSIEIFQQSFLKSFKAFKNAYHHPKKNFKYLMTNQQNCNDELRFVR